MSATRTKGYEVNKNNKRADVRPSKKQPIPLLAAASTLRSCFLIGKQAFYTFASHIAHMHPTYVRHMM